MALNWGKLAGRDIWRPGSPGLHAQVPRQTFGVFVVHEDRSLLELVACSIRASGAFLLKLIYWRSMRGVACKLSLMGGYLPRDPYTYTLIFMPDTVGTWARP